MNKLIAKITENNNWEKWVKLNSMGNAGCVSGEKNGCVSAKRGCVWAKGKSGCIS